MKQRGKRARPSGARAVLDALAKEVASVQDPRLASLERRLVALEEDQLKRLVALEARVHKLGARLAARDRPKHELRALAAELEKQLHQRGNEQIQRLASVGETLRGLWKRVVTRAPGGFIVSGEAPEKPE